MASKKDEPAAPSSVTYRADDVSNAATGEAEQQPAQVTYRADHVPDDAPVVMGKKVAAPKSPSGPAAVSQAETA